MNFLELQNQTIANAFDESERDKVKTWINARYGWLWDADNWAFKKASDDVTVTAGSMAVTLLPTDLAVPLGMLTDNGCPLKPTPDITRFYDLYLDAPAGTPEAFTRVGDTILVGPPSNVTISTFKLLYEKAPTMLAADTDEPSIPDHHHIALVFGAKAAGFKLANVPLWETFDADFQGAIEMMRRQYLPVVRGAGVQVPRHRPEIPAWR